MDILAIDPSFSSTGYCVIDQRTREIKRIERYITTNKVPENERICMIVSQLQAIMDEHGIYHIAMEDGYVGASMRTSLSLSKLRGGIITHFMMTGYQVDTKMPSEIRKNMGLAGNAKKEEVANEILRLYPHLLEQIGPYSDKQNKKKTSDMYDSVGIGISYLNTTQGS